MKNHITLLQNGISIFLLFLLLTACESDIFGKKNNFEVKWKGKINAPLGYMSFDASQITEQLGKGVDITKDPNGFLKLKKEIDINETPNDFDIPNKTQMISFSSNTIATPPTGASSPYTVPIGSSKIKNYTTAWNTKTQSISYSKELTSMNLKSGDIILTTSSTFDINVDLEVECISLVHRTNGTTFKRTIPINKKTTGTTRNFGSLGDYDLDLSNDGTGTGKTNNTIIFKSRLIFRVHAGDIIDTNDRINFTIELRNIAASKVFGDFKSQTISLKTQEIDLFPKKMDFEIEIENPTMDMELNNGFGIPMGITPNKIVAKKTGKPDVNLTYTNAATKNLLLFGPATINASTKNVEKKKTNLTIDKNNSNLVAFFNASPEKAIFNVEATTNPNAVAGTPNQNFYADSEKEITGKVTIRLPLSIKLKEFEYIKEQDFKINYKFEKYVEDFDLIFYTKNTMPLEGEINLDFLDSSGNKITFKSTIEPLKIEADKDNKEISNKNVVKMSKEDIENFNKVKKIKFVTKLKSKGTDFVKLYEQNKMEIQISIKANGKYTL